MANRNEIDFGVKYLDNIIEWIASRFNPEDVFGTGRLEEWAREWAEKQSEWIPDPDQWAFENGYIQE